MVNQVASLLVNWIGLGVGDFAGVLVILSASAPCSPYAMPPKPCCVMYYTVLETTVDWFSIMCSLLET